MAVSSDGLLGCAVYERDQTVGVDVWSLVACKTLLLLTLPLDVGEIWSES